MDPFGIFARRHRPTSAEIAALRDELLIAQTKVVLLEDIVRHPPEPRRLREKRKDASEIEVAKIVMTTRLLEAFGRASEHRG